VDTRDALQGEVVNIGQPIVTLINEDDLWVRADVEETYIDRIKIGQTLQVKLPSGAVLDGTVFLPRRGCGLCNAAGCEPDQAGYSHV